MSELSDQELIDAFLTYQTGRSFSAETIRRRRYSLMRFARSLAPLGLRQAKPADIDDFLTKLNTPRTRHAYRSDLAVFYAWSVRRDLLVENPVVKTDTVRVPRSVPRPAPAEVIAEALRISTGTVQLAILLGALAGLRVGEMVALQTDDLFLDKDPPVLVVRGGKGGKDRIVPIHPTLQDRLRHLPRGWLFKGVTMAKPLQATSLGVQVTKALNTAAGSRQRYTTHTLRHHFGTAAAQWSDGNVVLVGQLMGHANPNTTMGYIGWNPTAGAEVVSRIVVPGAEDDELAARRSLRTAVGS